MQQGYEEFLASIDTAGFDSVEDWNIHSRDIEVKEAIRRQIAVDFPDVVETIHYNNPEAVHWSGYTTAPGFGGLGFIDLDGETILYRW